MKKLTRIVIENYRNIAYLEIEPSEKGFILEGKNGVGKTNVLEAILWTLTDKLFSGVAQSERQGITPINAKKGIQTSVELTFNDIYIFKKIYYERYNADGDLTSRETTYAINGGSVKTNRQAFANLHDFLGVDNVINDFSKTKLLSDIDFITLLYNTSYLKEIDSKNLRALVVDMTGEVLPETIINAQEKYAPLREPFLKSNKDLEALKEKLRVERLGNTRANISGLNLEIASLENSIQEFNNRASQVIDRVEIEKAKKELKELDRVIFEKEQQLMASGSELKKDLEIEITKLENEIYVIKETLRKDYEQKLQEHNAKIDRRELDKKIVELEEVARDKYSYNKQISEKEILLSRRKNELNTLEMKRENLLKQWQDIKENKGENLTCPHCEKPFELHDTKEHAIIIKARLDEINKSGLETKNEIIGKQEAVETTKKELETIKKELEKLEKQEQELNDTIEPLAKTLENHKNQAPALVLENDSINTLLEKTTSLKTQISELEQSENDVKNTIRNEIADLREQKTPLLDVATQETIIKRYKKDAEELQETRQQKIERLNIVEQLEFLIKETQREMLTETENRVANIFGENIKFELFKVNISNDTIDSRVCNMLVKDIHNNFVDIKHINTGDYPRVALDFLARVKEHYEIPKSFVFVDELQSLDHQHQTQLFNLGEQVIASRVGKSQELLEVIKL